MNAELAICACEYCQSLQNPNFYKQKINADIAKCKCNHCEWLKQPKIERNLSGGKWVADRAPLRNICARPDLPVFWLPYFELLGHYWIKQTKHEDIFSYLDRCLTLYRSRFSQQYTESEFVERVGLGLRSFSWSVVCYVQKPQTFREVFRLVAIKLGNNARDLCYQAWNKILFPHKKRVSVNLIKAYLGRVAFLRRSIKPPKNLVDEVQIIFNRSVEEVREEHGDLEFPARVLRQWVREKVLENVHFRFRLQPYIHCSNIYKSNAYLSQLPVGRIPK